MGCRRMAVRAGSDSSGKAARATLSATLGQNLAGPANDLPPGMEGGLSSLQASGGGELT